MFNTIQKPKESKLLNVIGWCYVILSMLMTTVAPSHIEEASGKTIPVAGVIILFAIFYLTLFFLHSIFVIYAFIMPTIAFITRWVAYGFLNDYTYLYLIMVILGVIYIVGTYSRHNRQ